MHQGYIRPFQEKGFVKMFQGILIVAFTSFFPAPYEAADSVSANQIGSKRQEIDKAFQHHDVKQLASLFSSVAVLGRVGRGVNLDRAESREPVTHSAADQGKPRNDPYGRNRTPQKSRNLATNLAGNPASNRMGERTRVV